MKDTTWMFTREEIEQAMQIWEKTAFTIVDIRHALVKNENGIDNYQTPSCVLLFTCEGEGQVNLDENIYRVDRFRLVFCGKGTKLSICPTNGWLEYYMILYKTLDPGFYRNDYLYLLKKQNPFQKQFVFIPGNPIYFLEQFKKIYGCWIDRSTKNRFYVKSAFYQMIYESYEELSRENARLLQPDMIETLKKYFEEHFQEAISIQELAEAYHISISQLSRLFKARENVSPKEYLTRKRLNAATVSLSETDATVREIALYCGFGDEFSFTKIFKKYKEVTPGEFRKKSTSHMRNYAMEKEKNLLYNYESSVSCDELEKGGDYMIFRNKKNNVLLATILSGVMLLSACQTNQVNEKEVSTTKTSDTVSEKEAQNNQEKEDTRVIHMEYGDVEIPANPKRVAIEFFQGDLLAFGIKPVATSFNDDAVFEQDLSDVIVLDAFNLNREAVMEAEPDLIIWNNPDDYEELSKIAPTIAVNFYSGMNYEERIRFMGEIFGLEDKAEQIIGEFQAKIEKAKETLSQKGLMDKNVILLENRQQGVLRAFGNDYGRGGEIIYQYLGLLAPERIQKEVIEKEDVQFIDVGYEVLNEYVGDYIFSDENIESLKADEMWNSLPAVKENRLIQTSSGMFWFSDITSMNAQLDYIVDSMVKTVE